MKFSNLGWTAVAVALVVSMGAAPAAAKGGSSNAKVKVKAPSVRPTATAKSQTPKVKATGAAKSARATTPSASAKSAKATQKSSPTTARGNDAKSPLSATAGPTDVQPTDTNPTELVPALPLSKTQQKLAKNTKLAAKLQTQLGTDIKVINAASDFPNLGQFVAAVNVSNNLGLSFTALKRLMVGDQKLSLGQAIQRLRSLEPAVATTTADTALAQANAEIAASAPTTTRKTKPKS